MNQVELRASITGLLQEVDNIAFLKAIQALLSSFVQEQKSNPIIGYDTNGVPKYVQEMKSMYDHEVAEALEAGVYTSIDEFKRKSASWFSSKDQS